MYNIPPVLVILLDHVISTSYSYDDTDERVVLAIRLST